MKNTHFVIGILIVICLAKLAPYIGSTGGILRPEITVKYLAVFIIFLNSGLTLPTEKLASSILQWDVHLAIQSFTFVAFPAIVAMLVMALRYTFIQPALLDGMTILSTTPPPVSSAIILTRAVGGNEGSAVFNSVLGSTMGIVVTPFLIFLLLGSKSGDVPTDKIFLQLFMTVVVPLLIGQMIRNFSYRWLQKQNIPFSTIGQMLILFIIYTTFCDTFSRTDFEVSMGDLCFTVFLIFSLQALFMTFLLYSSSYANFPVRDCITIMYCGTHKSLTLGIPMIEIIFEGSPEISALSIPLLIYNPAQIVFGALSIGLMQHWVEQRRRQRRKPAFSWYHV